MHSHSPRLALITSATSGIGQATAQAFAKQGIRLVLCGRDAQRLAALQEELQATVAVHTLRFDVGHEAHVRAAFT